MTDYDYTPSDKQYAEEKRREKEQLKNIQNALEIYGIAEVLQRIIEGDSFI